MHILPTPPSVFPLPKDLNIPPFQFFLSNPQLWGLILLLSCFWHFAASLLYILSPTYERDHSVLFVCLSLSHTCLCPGLTSGYELRDPSWKPQGIIWNVTYRTWVSRCKANSLPAALSLLPPERDHSVSFSFLLTDFIQYDILRFYPCCSKLYNSVLP